MSELSETPETDAMEEDLYQRRPSGYEVEQTRLRLCRKFERERNAARDALLLAAEWGISSDGFSAEVSSEIRCWIIKGMEGKAPTAPEYYPKRRGPHLPLSKDIVARENLAAMPKPPLSRVMIQAEASRECSDQKNAKCAGTDASANQAPI